METCFYGRSILKIALNEGPLLQRFIPVAYYDLSLSAARGFLAFLNRTHKYVGADAVAIFPVHALLMGPAQWNLFLKMVLILIAWQGIFGLFLVVRFPIKYQLPTLPGLPPDYHQPNSLQTNSLASACGQGVWAGRVKRKTEPWSGADSTQIRPPWYSTMRWQTARPMPEPAYSLREFSRWKMLKIRSR